MANPIVSNSPFQNSASGVRSYNIDAGSGTATLQSLAGNDPDNDTWVAVPDGAYTADTNASMYAVAGIQYRFVLTGDASGWISG